MEERQLKSIDEKTEQAMKEAANRVVEENQEWKIAIGEDDGGPAECKIEKPKNQAGRNEGRGTYRGRGSVSRGDGGGGGRGDGRGEGSHDRQGQGGTGRGNRGGGREGGSHDNRYQGDVLVQPHGNSQARYQEVEAQGYSVQSREDDELFPIETRTNWW